MISEDFLKILCCPKQSCRGDLIMHGDDQKLLCTICNASYPVQNGIPILFPNQNQTELIHKRHWDKEVNASSYAKKYNAYLKKQGSSWGLYTHQSELAAIRQLTKGINLTGKTILDCGCGNGRLLTEYNEAKTKIGLDASLNLLLATKEREPDFWLVCAQAEDLPIKDAVADFSVSIRVFQHLRAPEEAFAEMVRTTKPSGYVSLQNYNKWNLKEAYKKIRMLPFCQKHWNWGLAFDDYTSAKDILKWSNQTFVKPVRFVGSGWGFYFYILEVFSFRRFAPEIIQKIVYTPFFFIEKKVQTLFPFKFTMEKINFIGSVQSGSIKKPNILKRITNKIRREIIKRKIDSKIKRFENRNHAHTGNDIVHVNKAIDWLLEAQRQTPDGGVSRGYSLIPQDKANRTGWQPSYPETTGYIIPTMIEAAKNLNREDLITNALQMTNWLSNIQNEDGSIQGGNIGEKPKPAIFDTGQIARGFIAAHKVNDKLKYLDKAVRAGNFILANETIENSEKTGSWKENNATSVNQTSTTYNIYAIAPLVELGQITNNNEFLELGDRTAKYTVSMQNENGWFRECDFEDSNNPLLHTIAYTIDGLFDIGVILKNQSYIDSSLLALDAVIKTMDESGEIPGKLNKDWESEAKWACLTGMAQIGVISVKAYKLTGNERYHDASQKIKEYLKSRQNNFDRSLAPLGSIWGSWPISGQYGHYQVLNWAVKFFADLLLLSSGDKKNV